MENRRSQFEGSLKTNLPIFVCGLLLAAKRKLVARDPESCVAASPYSAIVQHC